MTPPRMGKKQTVITKLYAACKARGDMTFDNDEVKRISNAVGFANPFDATKWDNSAALPAALKADDVFVVHLGQGRHRFVSGIDIGYHAFEPIPEQRRYQWYYRRSMLNSINTSESNVPLAVYNERILHDYLYADITVSPSVHFASRARIPLRYRIVTDEIAAQGIPVGVDFTTELGGKVTVFEARHGEPADFNVLRLFSAFHFYLGVAKDISASSVLCCYVLRKEDRLRLYLYGFDDPRDPGSMQLEHNAEYTLVER